MFANNQFWLNVSFKLYIKSFDCKIKSRWFKSTLIGLYKQISTRNRQFCRKHKSMAINTRLLWTPQNKWLFPSFVWYRSTIHTHIHFYAHTYKLIPHTAHQSQYSIRLVLGMKIGTHTHFMENIHLYLNEIFSSAKRSNKKSHLDRFPLKNVEKYVFFLVTCRHGGITIECLLVFNISNPIQFVCIYGWNRWRDGGEQWACIRRCVFMCGWMWEIELDSYMTILLFMWKSRHDTIHNTNAIAWRSVCIAKMAKYR